MITKIAVSGACGKMGSKIIDLAASDQNLEVVLALEREGHPQIGGSIGDIKISGNPEDIESADCLIDFSSPKASINYLKYLLKHKKAGVIGTTGFDFPQLERIRETSNSVPIVFSPNMSIGVNLLFKLVKEAVSKLSSDYKVTIREAHHIHKKDSPSGTAKHLAEIVQETSAIEGKSGIEVTNIESIREGEIVGDHKVILESGLDTIELSHCAKTRDIFARGALEAAKWVVKQDKGLYNMGDVL